jgi:hypothetical protein
MPYNLWNITGINKSSRTKCDRYVARRGEMSTSDNFRWENNTTTKQTTQIQQVQERCRNGRGPAFLNMLGSGNPSQISVYKLFQ